MTTYGRTYIPPIFHVVDANEEQIKLMDSVFDSLTTSYIDFVEVRRNAECHDTIDIITHGLFTEKERAEILAEIQEVYDVR